MAPLKQYWIPVNALSVAQIEALSAQRKAKAERYLFEKDRLLCLAAGVLIDRGLQEYGLREADVRFACTFDALIGKILVHSGRKCRRV